jgi:hypothetical protein
MITPKSGKLILNLITMTFPSANRPLSDLLHSTHESGLCKLFSTHNCKFHLDPFFPEIATFFTDYLDVKGLKSFKFFPEKFFFFRIKS